MIKRRWILLRGLARESGHWGDFQALLTEAFPQDEVAFIDLPGSGKKNKEKCPVVLNEFIHLLREDAKTRLGGFEKNKPIVLGISFGAMSAYAWSCRFPEDFLKVVLINPSFKGLNPWYQRLRPQTLPRLLSSVLSVSESLSEKKILEVVSNVPMIREKSLEAWTQIRKKRKMSVENIFRQLFVASQIKMDPNLSLKHPLLILGSAQDRMVDIECSKKLSKIMGAPLKLHPDAGHDLTLDDPYWVVEQLKLWI